MSISIDSSTIYAEFTRLSNVNANGEGKKLMRNYKRLIVHSKSRFHNKCYMYCTIIYVTECCQVCINWICDCQNCQSHNLT